MTARERLPRPARLRARREIDALFAGGQGARAGALTVVFEIIDPARQWERRTGPRPRGWLRPAPVQLIVSVPKRLLRHAHDRNRVKRQLREIWRRQMLPVLLKDVAAAGAGLKVALIYKGTGIPRGQMPEFDALASQLLGTLPRLRSKLAAAVRCFDYQAEVAPALPETDTPTDPNPPPTPR